MAADNYSDVVQALANQIVSACSKLINANVPKQIGSANIDASQITGDTSLISGGYAGSVDASGVIGLNQVIANAIANSNIDVTQILRFDEGVGVAVERASINWADIQNLSADIARIAVAEISTATIDTAQIRDLETEVATISQGVISSAVLGTANIDWAHIEWADVQNLVSENSIFTKSVTGQMYIRDLAVTEANIVSLSVGELIVKGNDGAFYAVTVNEQGEIVAIQKQVANTDLEDLAVTNDKIDNQTINGDLKMIEGSITARTLNAENIFADSALIRELIAQNINVDTLFAREATLAAINTLDITGNGYLQMYVETESADQAQQAIINMDDDSLAMRVMNTERFANMPIGSRNYIRNSRDMILDGVHSLIEVENNNLVGVALTGVAIVE